MPPATTPVPPAPPRTPRPPLSSGRKIGFAAAAVAVVVAVGAVLFIQQRNRAPSDGLVRDTVEKLVGNPQLKLTRVTSTVTPSTDALHASVTYQAEAEVREALYEEADTTALLRDDLKLDPEAWQRTRKVLSGKTAPRILELAGLKGVDPTLLQTTFLHETTAKGAKLSYSGTLRAAKGSGGWQLQSERQNPATGELRGKPRSAFGGATMVVDDPVEMKKIQALATAQADLPAKVEAGRAAFLQERQAGQEKVIAELIASITPGAVFAGPATVGHAAPVKIFLEFTAVDTRLKQVTAVLRNDGSWSAKRALKGDFAFDADSETLALTLATTAEQAVPEAGPLLSDEDNWTAVFQLSGDKMTVHDNQRDFALTRMAEAELAAARKEIEAPAVALLDATETGKIYRGVIRRAASPETFDYVLRFNQQDREGATGTATLEPAGREAWQRTYHGTLVANRYHAGGAALRLESQADEAVKAATASSPAGQPQDSTVSLRLENGRLRGEGPDFSYDFAALSPEEITKLETVAAEREKALLAIVKEATAYPGLARFEGAGTPEKVRLRFRRVGSHGTTVDAVIESLDHPGVSRDFRGSLDPFARTLTLTSTGKGSTAAGSRAGLKFPLLTRPNGQLLTLQLTDNALSGDLGGEAEGWKLLFPFAGAVEVTGSIAGDYPTEPGAYVWQAGAWQPLPRNDSKVSKSALKAISGFFNNLGKSSNAPTTADKVGDLVFTGRDSVPTVEGGEVRVVYVGAMNGERLEKNPQLEGYPAMEMAATASDSNGHRKVILSRIAPNATAGGFRERRVPATLDQVSDTLIELSCTRRLPPGSYAIFVNEEGFELKVE